jgi:hypothetical protein
MHRFSFRMIRHSTCERLLNDRDGTWPPQEAGVKNH